MAATTCYIHPKKAANTSCENCNRPICPADHRSFVKKGVPPVKMMVCPDCQSKLGTKARNTWIFSLSFFVVFLVAFSVYIQFYGGGF